MSEFIVPLLLVAALLALRMAQRRRAQAQFERSFRALTTMFDGKPLSGETAQILLKGPLLAMPVATRGNALPQADVAWTCRTPEGEYFLAVGHAIGNWSHYRIDWQLRPLTEARARQALSHDRKRYRAAFGEDPSP